MGTRSLQARWAQRHSGIEQDGAAGVGAGSETKKEQDDEGDGDGDEGSEDASIRWGAGVGGDGAIASRCLQCHPRCDVVASAAGSSVCLWQPA